MKDTGADRRLGHPGQLACLPGAHLLHLAQDERDAQVEREVIERSREDYRERYPALKDRFLEMLRKG